MTPERQREMWRLSRRKYRAKHLHRCHRCASEALPRIRKCAWCLALQTEALKPGLEHDTLHHAEMLLRSRCRDSECAASGLTLEQLLRVGQTLQVDRINPYRGYVRGNCQLLAASLNRAKWRHEAPPEWEVEALVRQAQLGPSTVGVEAALMRSLRP